MKRYLLCGMVSMLATGFAPAAFGAESMQVKVPYYDLVDVRIPAMLFDQPVYLVVDTGAEVTFLDAPYREQLGTALQTGTVNTISTAQFPLSIYPAPKLSIGGQPLPLEQIACLDFGQLHAVGGIPFAGILGMDALQHSVITIDPDQRQFSIAAEVPVAVKEHAQAIPLTPVDDHGALQLPVQINGMPINLELDSGENNFLGLNPVDWAKIFHDGKESVRENLIVGADSRITRSLCARIPSVVIGGTVYTNVLVNSLSNPTIASHVGYGFLKQHIATLDVSNRVLYLTPSKQFGVPQEADMSGLYLILVKEKILVYALEPKSPAELAGIKRGEEVVAVNGEPVTARSLQEVRQMLRQQDGLAVTIKLRNDDKTEREVSFRLKRMI